MKDKKKVISLIFILFTIIIWGTTYLATQELLKSFKNGDWVKVKGNVTYDNYEKEDVLTASAIEKIEVDVTLNKSPNGSLMLESPTATPCKGDTLVFKGQGNDGYSFSEVAYQYRMFEGGEIMSHGTVSNIGDTVTMKIDNTYDNMNQKIIKYKIIIKLNLATRCIL